MQQPTTSASSPAPSSFSSLLTTLAAPAQKTEHAWNDDDLADDVAILSYERALRGNTLYSSASLNDQPPTQAVDPEPIRSEKVSSVVRSAAPQPATHTAVNLKSKANPDSNPNRIRATSGECNLKEASVTIRMSKAECAQLHKRAAEAGLTVSAYLRSCTLEAESLREMVKETLAQLRMATNKAKPAISANSAPPSTSRFQKLAGCLGGIFTPLHSDQRVARA
jgi:predicted DNA binding CopG/RHH family protein